MSRQLSVKSFFKRPNSCDIVNKGEKRGIDAEEDEGQTDKNDQSPLPTTTVTGQPQQSGSRELRREYRVQWEQEFTWLRRKRKICCDICRKAKMSNGFVRGCTTMQKSALTDHKSSQSHNEALRVVNQSVAMSKHVEKSQAACNEALKTQFKVVLHMANTNTPSHQYPDLIHLLQSAGCPNLNSAHTYTHHDTVSQMEEAIAMTITNAVDDRIANSRYVGIIVDETTNITVEKMLITYLTLQHGGDPETVFIGNHTIPSATAECITAKIKNVLSGRGVTMDRVVGLGSDGANVMVGRKAGVAQHLRENNCPYLINIHCGAHRRALAARDASNAVRDVSAYVTTINNIYTYYKNSPIRTNRLNKLQNEMEAHDLLSLKQPSATRWLSLERAVKGIRANWVSLVMELEEEENSRNCPIAKGGEEDVNISHIQPVVNMTLASLEDLMNEPGTAETEFNKELQDSKFCGITLTQADAEKFSVLRTEYIAELTKSIRKRFPLEHVGLIADLDTVLNASRYPGTDSALKNYGLDALERVCVYYGTQRGAAVPLVQKERALQDFLAVKRVLAGSGRPTFRESCKHLITSFGEMFPDYKTLAEVALVIPVSSVAAERGFSMQNNIKTVARSRLSEAKTQNLMTIASASVTLDSFDYAQASTQFKSMRTRRKPSADVVKAVTDVSLQALVKMEEARTEGNFHEVVKICRECLEKQDPVFEDTNLHLLRVLSTASEVWSLPSQHHQRQRVSAAHDDGYTKLYHPNNAQLGMATMRAGVTHWHAGLIEAAHGLICRAYGILMITHGPHHPITKDLE
ncbi:hypothetical protein QQF64_034240 [Cirrhinus molitorella]|uniref:Zinc finger protein 862 n=1 Tax=Cirrhinus molitorella TaxID=172907 RepID=A0ABR3MW68_9TELE